MDLSIIIVSWNVCGLLEKCLISIYEHTRGISFEIFVIDNGSADKTVKIIKKHFLKVKLIANQKNLGFAAANNQGIKKAKGDYILLLNPDTELKEDSFRKMIDLIKSKPKCGILGCHLENPDGSHQASVRRFPKFLDQGLILLKLHHLFPKLNCFKRYLYSDFDYSKESLVDQIMGACFMIKREVIQKIGMLDENFFVWFEEVDYCLRAKQVGWDIVYTPATSIIHHFGQSFKQIMTLEKQRMWSRSLRYYFLKHYSFLSFLVISALTKLSFCITIMISWFSKIYVQ